MSNFCLEYCKEVCNYLDCTTCPTWIEEEGPEEIEIPYNGAFPWDEEHYKLLGIEVSNNTPKECPGGDTWYMYEYEYALIRETL